MFKICGRIANSVNTNQTAPLEQSDLGLYCLVRPVCLGEFKYKIYNPWNLTLKLNLSTMLCG